MTLQELAERRLDRIDLVVLDLTCYNVHMRQLVAMGYPAQANMEFDKAINAMQDFLNTNEGEGL